jgi:hypothetical protein
MQVFVEGSRSTSDDWLWAQQLPASELPALSDEQKSFAEKLGISPEDYARSTKAGELTRRELQAKAETFGRLLEQKIRDRAPNASVESVVLLTFEGKFRVVTVVGGKETLLQIDEELVDDLLQSGSPEMETRLDRIIDLNLPNSEAARAS